MIDPRTELDLSKDIRLEYLTHNCETSKNLSYLLEKGWLEWCPHDKVYKLDTINLLSQLAQYVDLEHK